LLFLGWIVKRVLDFFWTKRLKIRFRFPELDIGDRILDVCDRSFRLLCKMLHVDVEEAYALHRERMRKSRI